MKPFYFHVFASGEFYADDEGCTCSSLHNARLHAIRLIKLIVDLAPSIYPWQSWSVIVAASDGAPVLAVPFAGHVREVVNAKSKTLLQRRSYPQVITYGDAAVLGTPANEQSAEPARPRAIPPRLPRALPGRPRRIWLARLLNRFTPRWLTAPSARRFPLRPRASVR